MAWTVKLSAREIEEKNLLECYVKNHMIHRYIEANALPLVSGLRISLEDARIMARDSVTAALKKYGISCPELD